MPRSCALTGTAGRATAPRQGMSLNPGAPSLPTHLIQGSAINAGKKEKQERFGVGYRWRAVPSSLPVLAPVTGSFLQPHQMVCPMMLKSNYFCQPEY